MLREPPRRQSAGFTLLEMLVSLALTLVALGILFTALIAFRKLHFDHTQRIGVEQEMRASYEFLTRDLESAGFRLIARGKLGYFGTVFPNGDASDAVTTNSLTIWRNAEVAEGVLTETMPGTADPVRLDNTIGFTVGLRVWVIGYCTDGEVHRDAMIVTGVTSTPPFELSHATPDNPSDKLSCRYKTGARVVRLEQITYALQPGIDGGQDLTRRVNEAAPAVVASGLSALAFSYFNNGAPASLISPTTAQKRRDIRRLRIDLTGTASEKMRGSGLAPSVSFRGDIAPRNLILQENL